MSLSASPRNRPEGFDLEKLAEACCHRMEDEYNRAGRIASPIPLPIIKIEMETSDIATIWLQVPTKLAAEYKPGQYFMCWNPYDSNGGMSERNHNSEKPYSVGDIMIDTSKIDSKTAADSGKSGRALIGFTIKNLGRQSGDLTKMKCGDWLALRGPFGTTFPAIESSSTLLLVSGGIGSTPMHMAAFAARQKLGSKVVIHAIMGFRNEDETHYVSRMEEVSDTVTITTDDGSQGIHGYPTKPLGDLLSSCADEKTVLFTCGPEPMMKPVLQMAVDAGIDCYAAMERYLPCSVAACGLCMVGDRLTCRDGPVMEGDWLLKQDDFGQAH